MKTKKQMSLEEYLNFYHSNKQVEITVDYLRQIFGMHGYTKTSIPKRKLTDALRSLDLVNPSRSTLKENISSLAIISLEDIIKDLNDLNWQECCVTSVQIFSSDKQTSTLSPKNSEPKSKLKALKSRSVNDIYSNDGTSSSCASEIDMPKRKLKSTTKGLTNGSYSRKSDHESS